MILHRDTSAVVKRYVREGRSDDVRKAWREARRVATSEVAFAEAAAAFARRWRPGDRSDRAHDELRLRFLRDFGTLVRVPVSTGLNRRISELVCTPPSARFRRHSPRLGSLGQRSGAVQTVFACFDDDLASAARAAGLELL